VNSLPTLFSLDTAYHQKIIDYALDHPSLKSLQALTILALSYISCGLTKRLCGVMAILTKLSATMSLQPIDDFPQRSDRSTDTLELEERRRCFWAIFVLDRISSASTGWPMSFPEMQTHANLPCLEKEFQLSRECISKQFMNDSMAVTDIWAYCVESVGILGRVIDWIKTHKNLESDGMALGKSVEKWWSRLPKRITAPENVSKDEVGSFILLHATYNTYISTKICC
jgi:hypothetical protein